MRHIKLAMALSVVLLLGAALGYWIAGHTGDHQHAAAASPSAKGDRKVLYWHDPMVPGQRFDKPGKSPFMDMDLVPVYADEEAGSAAVRISPELAQNLGIRLGKVERSVLTPHLMAIGAVAFDERLLHLVQSRADGYVSKLYVKAPFQSVRKGQSLAELVAPEWLSAQEEYLALLDVQSERGAAIRDAARRRLQTLGIPDSAIRELELSRKTSAATTLSAPIDGVVSELSVREGAAISAGAPLFRINGTETVWVNAQVPEAQVSMIPTGSTVIARAMAWPGEEFSGRVLEILPDLEPQSRTLPVRVELRNTGRKLAPGMFVSLNLKAPQGEPQLMIPTEAVIVTGERNVVIVAREGGGFDVAPVMTGLEAEGKTAILSGLAEGQSIVLSGQFLIDSEASLRSALSRIESTTRTAPPDKPTAPRAHLTQGTITALEAADVTISHEPVPSLNWPSMTMPFKWPPGLDPSAFKVGDRVSFSFVEAGGGSYRVEMITKLEPNAPDAERAEPGP